jgi:short-subunit dehydrogenase
MLAQNTQCHIVNTASVAGLIVGGSPAPYSVTKHAVVALSESLYLALEERNALVKVSVLCPGFVKTNLTNAERNRPVALQNEPVELSPEAQARWAFMNAAVEAGISPLQVADQVFEAIKKERFYILTHPERNQLIQLRVEDLILGRNPRNPADTLREQASRHDDRSV